jgi:hypothetical protein
MVKYLINENFHGYEKADIGTDELNELRDSLVIVVINKNCDNEVGKYYKAVSNLLKHNNRVIAIGIEDENRTFKTIAALMVTFEAYDIYEVHAKEDISAPYLQRIEGRNPDIIEVQTYIGGDVTAYADMQTILFAIQSLVDDGDVNGLEKYVEQNAVSIENLVNNLNKMKKKCNEFNSNELIDKANSLKEKADQLIDKIAEKDKQLEEVKHDRDEKEVEANTAKRDLVKLKNLNQSLQEQAKSAGSVVNDYKELQLKGSDVKCNAKRILYFKEISYVKYMNTFITNFMKYLDTNKITNVKLLIYDSNVNVSAKYGNLTIVTGKEYNLQKSHLISVNKAFVVAEPVPAIISDIVSSDKCFDIVIIYDRMGKKEDIVTNSSNITKFYVVNGSADYYNIKKMFKLTSTTNIITNYDTSIETKSQTNPKPLAREFLDIPYIENYKGSTESAKASQYIKLQSTVSGKNLFDTIRKLAWLDEFFKR